jgi:RecA-family ATPase
METKDLQIIPSTRLMKEPNRKNRWLVQNLLHTAGSSLWAGKQKVGKTTLLRQLSLCVARGDRFLGRDTRQGTVFYLALEEDRDEIKEHFRDMGCPDGEMNLNFHIGAVGGNQFQALKQLIEQHKPALVIIDTLGKFTKIKDLNNYSMVNESIEPITELARINDCHVLFVHHMNKSSYRGQDSVLGSVSLLAGVDTIVMVTEDCSDRYISTEQRYGRAMYKTMLDYDMDKRMYFLGNDIDLF